MDTPAPTPTTPGGVTRHVLIGLGIAAIAGGVLAIFLPADVVIPGALGVGGLMTAIDLPTR